MSFFVERAVFGSGELALDMSDGRVRVGTLRFNFVRSFLFVKESDFWEDFEKKESELILGADETAPRVHRIKREALLQRVVGTRWDEEEPSFFLLWTPDECFEVVGFEDPVWLAGDQGGCSA